MKNSNIIGLREEDCKNIAEKLNILLANYSVFYQNTRGAHWNIKGEHNGKKCVEDILNSFKVVIDLQRELLEITDKANDEGTNALVSGYITEQEKDVWMYNAYLG